MRTHSPGAVRAAKEITVSLCGVYPELSTDCRKIKDDIAAMIDAETACKELAEACKGLLVCMDLAGWAYDLRADKAREAIAKWEGRA